MLDIKEMLEALDAVAPGANSRHTLLYGVEAKFYSNRLELSHVLETKIPNFFAIGDGAASPAAWYSVGSRCNCRSGNFAAGRNVICHSLNRYPAPQTVSM